MAQQGTEFNSSIGRIVWGHPMKLQQRKDNNDNPIFNEDGTPAMGIAFGLAIPKADFVANEWPNMHAEASKGYPSGAPQNFSWKYKDGDVDKDSKGVPLSSKEGYAGCYILTISSNTGFPPAVYKFDPHSNQYRQMAENEIKAGDYVRVALNLQVNVPAKSTHTPSLYVNPQAIELIGYGTALASGGVDPMKAFGGQAVALPSGASATPIGGAPAGVGMPAPGGMPQQPAAAPQPGYPAQPMAPAPVAPQAPQPGYPAQPMAPAPQYAPQPAAPGGMPAPAHDFVHGQPQAPQPGYPAQPQAMPQYAPQPAPQPGYPAQPAAPGGMPGMMPPR